MGSESKRLLPRIVLWTGLMAAIVIALAAATVMTLGFFGIPVQTGVLMPLYLDLQLAIGKFAHVLELLALDTGIEGITAVESLRYRGEALLGLGSAIEAEKTFREAAALDSGSSKAIPVGDQSSTKTVG